MKKLITLLSLLLVAIMMIGCASTEKNTEASYPGLAESSKSIEEWQSEIEDITGPIEWKFKDLLKYANEFKGETFYDFGGYSGNPIPGWYIIVIADPMMKTENPKYIYSIPSYNYTLKNLKYAKIEVLTLKPGDVFFTYESSVYDMQYLWLLTDKKILQNVSKNANFSKQKGAFYGETMEIENTIYNTISEPDTGIFKIRVVLQQSNIVIEYSLQLLGTTNQEKGFVTAKNAEIYKYRYLWTEPYENDKILIERYGANHKPETLSKIKTTNTDLILIPAVTYEMGVPMDQRDIDYHVTGAVVKDESGNIEENLGPWDVYCDDNYQHQVELTAFYIGKTEVTQAEYKKIMGENPSNHSGENHPVENISWYDAIVFCNKLSILEGKIPCYSVFDETNPDKWIYEPHNGQAINSGLKCDFRADGYRLPTEAEWECAAKAGGLDDFKYSGSKNAEEVGWIYESNSAKEETHDVARRKPNSLGIFDMTGNVYEWCWDSYTKYSSLPAFNPITGGGWGLFANNHVIRGGCYTSEPEFCTVTRRKYMEPNEHSLQVGFRIACTAY